MKHIILITLSLLTLSANAALVQGTSSGKFENPVGGLNIVSTGIGTDSFSWGMPSFFTRRSSYPEI